MNKLPKGKQAIWLDDLECEVLSGFVAELLDRKELADYQITILQNVLRQLNKQ